MDSAQIEQGAQPGQVGCSMSRVLVRRVRAVSRDDVVAALLIRAASPRTAAHLENVENWIEYDEACALFEAAAELTGDAEIGLRTGEDMVRQHAGTSVATLLRSLGSPEAILEQVAVTVPKFSTVTAMQPLEVGPGQA